jgi:hypothetical protein
VEDHVFCKQRLTSLLKNNNNFEKVFFRSEDFVIGIKNKVLPVV